MKRMSDKLSKNDFNYASVDSDTASKLEYFAKSGKALLRKSQIQFMADMGKILSEARDLLANNKTGTFIKWATCEFDVSARTIWNLVNAWDRILCNGCTIYLNWSETAVYLASSKELPPPVIKKLERLPSTGIVRASDVKRIIEAAKPKPEPPVSATITTDSDDVPFDAVSPPAPKTLTPAELKAKERAEKTVAKAAEKERKKKEADAAREKKKADAAAAKEKAKADAKAARDKAKEDAKAAKMAALPVDEQVRLIKSALQQHIDRAVRLTDDLHRVKKNQAKRVIVVKLLQDAGLNLW